MYSIMEEPLGEVYNKLIDFAFESCDMFHLVIRKDMMSNVKRGLKRYQPILIKFEPSLIEIKEESEWASTQLGRSIALVYNYHTTEEAKKTLKELSHSLYGWIAPHLPEDLAFFKKGKPWLVSSAHEEWSEILADEQEVKRLLEIKGLKIEKADY